MTETAPPPLFERMKAAAAMIMQGTPHARALGFELIDVQRAKAWGKAPYREDLIGDPETGVIAGGVVTALMDNLAGVAVIAALEEPTSTATLDLRIDYMRPAEPGQDVLAMAHCYKVTRSVAFIRAVAYETDPDDPIATATGAFMLSSNAGRGIGANRRPPEAEPAKESA
jgi:uncharacterized protein (TIGR00369 family)